MNEKFPATSSLDERIGCRPYQLRARPWSSLPGPDSRDGYDSGKTGAALSTSGSHWPGAFHRRCGLGLFAPTHAFSIPWHKIINQTATCTNMSRSIHTTKKDLQRARKFAARDNVPATLGMTELEGKDIQKRVHKANATWKRQAQNEDAPAHAHSVLSGNSLVTSARRRRET
jgi:hypothetical protein